MSAALATLESNEALICANRFRERQVVNITLELAERPRISVARVDRSTKACNRLFDKLSTKPIGGAVCKDMEWQRVGVSSVVPIALRVGYRKEVTSAQRAQSR